MKLYWECPGCETTKWGDGSGGRNYVYQCSECRKYCCDRCGPGGERTKHCDYEYDYGDGDYGTNEGLLRHIGYVCTEKEWEEEQEQIRKAKERAQARELLYREKLKTLKLPFRADLRDGREYIGDIVASDLKVNGNSLTCGSIDRIKEIDLSQPCQCQPTCAVKHGRGYLIYQNGEKIGLHSWWEKKHLFASRKRYVNFWGKFDIKLQNQNRTVSINADELVHLRRYTPSINEVLGPA